MPVVEAHYNTTYFHCKFTLDRYSFPSYYFVSLSHFFIHCFFVVLLSSSPNFVFHFEPVKCSPLSSFLFKPPRRRCLLQSLWSNLVLLKYSNFTPFSLLFWLSPLLLSIPSNLAFLIWLIFYIYKLYIFRLVEHINIESRGVWIPQNIIYCYFLTRFHWENLIYE